MEPIKKFAVGMLVILVLGGGAVFLADMVYPDYTVYSYPDVSETEENISEQEVFPFRNLTSGQQTTFKKAVESPNSTIIKNSEKMNHRNLNLNQRK